MKFEFDLDQFNKCYGKRCPCMIDTPHNNTEDHRCPCLEFRRTSECRCGLFIVKYE